MKFLIIYIAAVFCSVGSTNMAIQTTHTSPILHYLQSESSALSSAQQSIQSFLQSKKIPVGGLPGSLRKKGNSDKESKLRIALSTKDNNLECRIALGRAPIGRKCVSPCGCTGSQQWIQFSELNRLRRKEPTQWTKCQTCQQTFDYSMISTHGGVAGNVVSMMLDNVQYLRASVVAVTLILGYLMSFGSLFLRFLTSRWWWQQYPKWVKIVNLPLVLKFWGGKIVLQYAFGLYLQAESRLTETLSDLETSIIEPKLPVENPEVLVDSQNNYLDDADDDDDSMDTSGATKRSSTPPEEEEEDEEEGDEG